MDEKKREKHARFSVVFLFLIWMNLILNRFWSREDWVEVYFFRNNKSWKGTCGGITVGK